MAQKLKQDPFDEWEKQFKLPSGFLAALFDEDDWSFLIKGSALMEAILTEGIVERTDINALRQVYEKLPLAHGAYGKIVFATQMKLITPEAAKFLRRFTDLRNTVVHKVQHIGFTFDEYLTQLAKPEYDNFVKAVSDVFVSNAHLSTVDVKEGKSKTPKNVVLFALMASLMSVHGYVQASRHRKLLASLGRLGESLALIL